MHSCIASSVSRSSLSVPSGLDLMGDNYYGLYITMVLALILIVTVVVIGVIAIASV